MQKPTKRSLSSSVFLGNEVSFEGVRPSQILPKKAHAETKILYKAMMPDVKQVRFPNNNDIGRTSVNSSLVSHASEGYFSKKVPSS